MSVAGVLAACGGGPSPSAAEPVVGTLSPTEAVDAAAAARASAEPSAQPTAVAVTQASPTADAPPAKALSTTKAATARATAKPSTAKAATTKAAPTKSVTVKASPSRKPVTPTPTPTDESGKPPQGVGEAQAVSQGMGTDGAPVVTVTATDSSCTPNVTSAKAGKVWFKIRNSGTKVNELYLENAAGDPLIEVENVDPGQGGAFAWTVKAGSYFVACKPGMGEEKLQTPFRVTG